MHLIFEERATIGIGIEIESATGCAQLVLGGLEDLMPVVNEWIVTRPDLVNDLHPRIMAGGVDADETSARSYRSRQRSNHASRFEFERCACAVGLRGNDEIIVGHGAARTRDDRIEQELVVL